MTPQQPHWLVIDQGGHGTRAQLLDRQGYCCFSHHRALSTENPQAGYYQQEAAALQQSLQDCLQALAATSLANREILAAALITQRASFIAVDKHSGAALTPVISWQDTRHSDWLQAKIHDGTFDIDVLQQLSGLRLNAHYGASKMRWLLDNDDAVQRAAREQRLLFLPLAAYMACLLTGQQQGTVDAVSASRTFLTARGATDWSPDLLQLFGIQRNWLPQIVTSTHAWGSLTMARQEVPLRLVGGDQSFIPFAYGRAVNEKHLFANLGTGAFVQTALPAAQVPSGLLCSASAVETDAVHFMAEGTVNAAASALDWLWQERRQALSFDELERALADVDMPPVFFHRITALGSPYWLPAGTSTFSEPASLAAEAVAVLESVVFLLAINMDRLLLAKPALQQVLVSGGLAHSDGLCQKLANCCRLPVWRHRDTEASARGAAFYLAGVEHYAPAEAAEVFTPERDAALLARYQLFYEWLRQEWLRQQWLSQE